MTKLILAISPDLNLLDQISAHLQEGGRFQVFCVSSGKDALALAAKHLFNLAILDAETNDLPFIPLTRELVSFLPGLKLLIYPPQNNSHHPVLNGVIADGYLNKPFFGPEVNEKIIRALSETNSLAGTTSEENTLTRLWIEHPEASARQIEQLLASTSASAGILLIHGQVVATSGALADETAQNVITFLTRYWTNIQSGELFRYLKMENETKTYLVYATPLFKEAALALIYHTNLPLIDIRSQVSLVRKAFLNSNTSSIEAQQHPSFTANVDDSLPADSALIGSSAMSVTAEEPSTPTLAAEVAAPQDLAEETAISMAASAADSLETEEEQPGLSEKELKSLDSLIAEMPAPDPEVVDQATPEEEPAPIAPEPSKEEDWLKISPDVPSSQANIAPEVLMQRPLGVTQPLPPHVQFSQAVGKTTPLPTINDQTQPIHPEEFPNFDFKLPWEEEAKQETPESEPDDAVSPLPVSQTKVQPSTVAGPSAISFRYQVLLLPRNPQQFITHDLADLLNRQLPRLHESNGWQCTGLSVRPLYMQWSVILPADTCLAEMVQEIKERTDIQIFAAFPTLLVTHPNGEFWANGYFCISGEQSFSKRLINDYISLSRQILSGLPSD